MTRKDVRAAAQAEYERVEAAAWAEYQRARAEYKRVEAAARAGRLLRRRVTTPMRCTFLRHKPP